MAGVSRMLLNLSLEPGLSRDEDVEGSAGGVEARA